MARQRCAMAEKRAAAKLKASGREQFAVAEQCLPECIDRGRVLVYGSPASTTRTVAPSAAAIHDHRIVWWPGAVAPIEDQMPIASNEVRASQSAGRRWTIQPQPSTGRAWTVPASPRATAPQSPGRPCAHATRTADGCDVQPRMPHAPAGAEQGQTLSHPRRHSRRIARRLRVRPRARGHCTWLLGNGRRGRRARGQDGRGRRRARSADGAHIAGG